jgi:hypothetical protein
MGVKIFYQKKFHTKEIRTARLMQDKAIKSTDSRVLLPIFNRSD